MQQKLGYRGLRDQLIAQRDGKSARRAVAETMGHELDSRSRCSGADSWASEAGRAPESDGSAKAASTPRTSGSTRSARAPRSSRGSAACCARGMLDAAAIEYDKALAAATTPTSPASSRGRSVELGDYDRAIELATPLVQADDHDATPAVTLGIARAARHEWQDAVMAFEQAFASVRSIGLSDVGWRRRTLSSATRARPASAACDQLKN